MDDPLVKQKEEIPIESYLGIWCASCCITKARCRAFPCCCCCEEKEGARAELWECSFIMCVIPMICEYTQPFSCVGCFYRSGSRRNKLSFKVGDVVLGTDLRILKTKYHLNEKKGTLTDEMPAICSSSKKREECRILRIPCCFC